MPREGLCSGCSLPTGSIRADGDDIMTRKTPFTPDEIALAEKLFARAKTTNTLKPPRAIAALALSNGFRQSVTASEVTYRDYP